MGPLLAEGDVLDARFVGALWPLVSAGWPGDSATPTEWAPWTTLFVDGPGVTAWALPMAALALCLTGSLPFSTVAVHPLHGLSELDASPPVDLDALLAHGLEAARLALTWATVGGGVPDMARAEAVLTSLADPAVGECDFDVVSASFDDCFASGTPADALPVLEAALRAGVAPEQADRLRALAAPLSAG